MNRLILLLLPGCFLFFISMTSLSAQSQAAAEGARAAYDIYSTGDYKAAAAAYEKLLKDYPTDGIVPNAQIQLAFAYYFQAEFDKALAILEKATSGPALPPELQQVADQLLPQILSAKAAAMPATDSKRRATFEQAIKKFTEFIAKYPNSDDLENAILSRAIAYYQIENYDAAVQDLELNIKKFPQSTTLPTSKNLLAITLATQGSMELSKADGADKAKAFALYKRATDILREIIRKKDDLALVNAANFQLGDILLNQAGASPEDARPPLYKEALAAFRSVAPKEEIVAMQKQKIKEFPGRKRAALAAKNQALYKQLNRENEHALKKLAELQAKPDQTTTALLKMAEIYFRQGDNNAARVMLKHVAPFVTQEDGMKRRLYFLTLTYALQNVVDQAAENYAAFQSKYKGDPLADNLPVVMGNMYLAANDIAEAVRLFDDSLTIYPKGRYVELSVVSKASAETRLGKLEDAMKTFQRALAANPSPQIGVVAQSGLASIYRMTKKWDEAIAAYKVVKDKYPDTPQAIEADYWIAFSTQQKGDKAAAIPMLAAFVKAHPKSPLAPLALYLQGVSQIALDQKEEGVAALTAVATQYPESQPAPFTYFQRAQIAATDGKIDDAVALWKQFIEKYPKDDKVYFAVEQIANAAIRASKTGEALTAYRDFVQQYPESPNAGEAMVKIAELSRVQAERLGRYAALNDDERSQWETDVESSIAASEEMLQKYPDSPSLALMLQTLLKSQRMLVTAELKQPSEIEPYFQALADSAVTPAAKSKLLFTLAAYVAEADKARALGIMTEAYNPDILYAPQDIDFYGLALIDQNKIDEAEAVFNKLAEKYPITPGVAPSRVVQEAQATALFGKGRIAQARGQKAEAGKLFAQLKTLYPWSPKVFEANYGIAQSLREQGKTDEAIALVVAIIREKNASAELRAESMLLGGHLMLDKMKEAKTPKEKNDFHSAAIDYFLKIAQFYGGVPIPAAEGLWQGGQLLEQQAQAATDPEFKARQLKIARGSYQQLVDDYPNSQYVPKAKERLTALGPQ